jgi:hypothetical protein
MFFYSALWQFFRVVAHNAEHFSALLPTQRGTCSTFLATTPIIFPRFRQQRRKMISVVANNVENKWRCW